jgi:hypothetical protein
MKPNIGLTDKIIRLFVGVFIIAFVGLYMSSWWGLIGVLPIFTVVTSRCMLYSLFGISTCKKNDRAKI